MNKARWLNYKQITKQTYNESLLVEYSPPLHQDNDISQLSCFFFQNIHVYYIVTTEICI